MHCFMSLSKTVAPRKTSHYKSEYVVVATCTKTKNKEKTLSDKFFSIHAWRFRVNISFGVSMPIEQVIHRKNCPLCMLETFIQNIIF